MEEIIQGDLKAIRLFKTKGIELDKDLYEQILYNVFINACKFNNKNGKIILTFAVYESSANRLKIETIIRDNGIGMKTKQLKKLGKVFENVRMANDLKDPIKEDDSTTSGYGLGLFLSLRLAKYLGGDLKIQSELNQGTKVKIQFLADISPLE